MFKQDAHMGIWFGGLNTLRKGASLSRPILHPASPLCYISQNANAVQGKLQEQLKMANQILTLAELARKAETEQEKARVDLADRREHPHCV